MFTYYYPKISGYWANCWQRLKYEVGAIPIATSVVTEDGAEITAISFDMEMTGSQKVALDNLMASNPGLPPTGTVKFKIQDINEKLDQFNSIVGLNLRLYYNQSLGSATFDTLEFHTSGNLTNTQKNGVMNQYAKLITAL